MSPELVLVALVALIASGLTLFSGFGLGTLLMPALALLFPVPVAIAATAVVHLLNNLFKLLLVGRHANARVVLRFGLPAGIAAVAGAWLLGGLAGLEPLASYELNGTLRQVHGVKLLVGLLVVLFAALELSPRLRDLSFPPRYLPAGGLVSGFFGGLSGNQGALRAAFLVRAGLDKNAFVGTSVVCSVIVDTLRIAVYGGAMLGVPVAAHGDDLMRAVVVAVVAAFAGAWFGVRLLGKVTLDAVRIVVAVMMALVGTGLATGLL